MKKLFLCTLTFLLIFGLTSCSQDEGEFVSPYQSLVGLPKQTVYDKLGIFGDDPESMEEGIYELPGQYPYITKDDPVFHIQLLFDLSSKPQMVLYGYLYYLLESDYPEDFIERVRQIYKRLTEIYGPIVSYQGDSFQLAISEDSTANFNMSYCDEWHTTDPAMSVVMRITKASDEVTLSVAYQPYVDKNANGTIPWFETFKTPK